MKGPAARTRMKTRPLTRKAFLRLLAVLGLSGATMGATGCGSSGGDGGGGPPPPGNERVQVFKLSSRGHRGCTACKNHARFKLFQSAAAADAHRAHAGCDCSIKVVEVSATDASNYFAGGPVYDRRSSG